MMQSAIRPRHSDTVVEPTGGARRGAAAVGRDDTPSVQSSSLYNSRYDSDSSDSDSDSSSASSLNEDDVRDVVKQVMLMVKHNNRRSSSTANSYGSRAPSMDSRETTTRMASSIDAENQHGGSSSVSAERPRGAPKVYHSASVMTYASMVGVASNTAMQQTRHRDAPVDRSVVDSIHTPKQKLSSDGATPARPRMLFAQHQGASTQSGIPSGVHTNGGCGVPAKRGVVDMTLEKPNGSTDTPRGAASTTVDVSMTSISAAEQRRVERLVQQRAEALRHETFTPRTSLPVDVVPEPIKNIPLRGKGHWEDRLYTEYMSRKKQRELEHEALRIAQATRKEIAEALDECSFTPDLSGIHDQMRQLKKDSPAFVDSTTPANPSRSGSVAGCLSNKERVLQVTERLYKLPAQHDPPGVLPDASAETSEQHKKPLPRRPSETQARLFDEHKRRMKDKARLLEERMRELHVASFVFEIKGNYYETLPLPQHADPASFERLYKESRKRQAKRTEQEEALARRPSPKPQISEYAQRRVRSAQPAFERLSTIKQHRTGSPSNAASPSPQDATLTLAVRGGRGTCAVDVPTLTVSHLHDSVNVRSTDQVLNWVNSAGRSAPVSRQESLNNYLRASCGAHSPVFLTPLSPTCSPTTVGFPSVRADGAVTAEGTDSTGPLNSSAHEDEQSDLHCNSRRRRDSAASDNATPLDGPNVLGSTTRPPPSLVERFVEVSSDSSLEESQRSQMEVDDSDVLDEEDDLALVVEKKDSLGLIQVRKDSFR